MKLDFWRGKGLGDHEEQDVCWMRITMQFLQVEAYLTKNDWKYIGRKMGWGR